LAKGIVKPEEIRTTIGLSEEEFNNAWRRFKRKKWNQKLLDIAFERLKEVIIENADKPFGACKPLGSENSGGVVLLLYSSSKFIAKILLR
jgi:hypothetical protein